MEIISQVLSQENIRDILSMMKMSSDNHEKADMYEEYLKPYGFKELGIGTNIAVYTHKDYPKYVFKFALDSNGFDDNRNDLALCLKIPRYNIVHEVHSSGVVSVQKKCKCFKSYHEISRYLKSIFKELDKLSEIYLLVDMSPINYKNYAIDPDTNDWCIIDGSDMIPLESGKIEEKCQRYKIDSKKKSVKLTAETKIRTCGGSYYYDDQYHMLICDRCGATLNPLELKRTMKEVNLLEKKELRTTGLTDELTDKLNQIILSRRNQSETSPSQVGKIEPDENEERTLHQVCPDDEDEDDSEESINTQNSTDNEDEDFPEPDDDDDDEVTATDLDELTKHLNTVEAEKFEDEDEISVKMGSLIDQLVKLPEDEREDLLSQLGYIFVGTEAIGSIVKKPVELQDIECGVVCALSIDKETEQEMLEFAISEESDNSPSESKMLIRFNLDDGYVDFTLGEILTKLKYKTWE